MGGMGPLIVAKTLDVLAAALARLLAVGLALLPPGQASSLWQVTLLGGGLVLLLAGLAWRGQEVARLLIDLACVRASDGKPARIPARWRAALGQEGV